MSDIIFLTVAKVAELQRETIRLHGGDQGIRDQAGLESAVFMPQSGIGGEYFHSDVFAMAAAYLFHIVMNHPFVDGNKRAGFAAASVFLFMNDYQLSCGQDNARDMVLSMAKGELDKEAAATFFRNNTKYVSGQ